MPDDPGNAGGNQEPTRDICQASQQCERASADYQRRAIAGAESESQQSKLLEAQHGEWLDTGTAGAAIGADKAMAALGEINRAENNRG